MDTMLESLFSLTESRPHGRKNKHSVMKNTAHKPYRPETEIIGNWASGRLDFVFKGLLDSSLTRRTRCFNPLSSTRVLRDELGRQALFVSW